MLSKFVSRLLTKVPVDHFIHYKPSKTSAYPDRTVSQGNRGEVRISGAVHLPQILQDAHRDVTDRFQKEEHRHMYEMTDLKSKAKYEFSI